MTQRVCWLTLIQQFGHCSLSDSWTTERSSQHKRLVFCPADKARGRNLFESAPSASLRVALYRGNVVMVRPSIPYARPPPRTLAFSEHSPV